MLRRGQQGVEGAPRTVEVGGQEAEEEGAPKRAACLPAPRCPGDDAALPWPWCRPLSF